MRVGVGERGAKARQKQRETAVARFTTELAVVATLDMLMQQKAFSDVTVTDVCEAAKVLRSTFYRHFRDLPDVVFWLWDHTNRDGIYQAGKTLSCHDAHLRTFEGLRRNRSFFAAALHEVDYASLTQYGGRVMDRYLRDVYRAKTGHEPSLHEDLRIEFYSSGAKHMTRHWATRGMQEEPEDMARAFTASMPDFMLPYLEPDPTCTVEVTLG